MSVHDHGDLSRFRRKGAVHQLPQGVYELLSTDALSGALSGESMLQPTFADIEDDVVPDVLARHLADTFRGLLIGYCGAW